MNRLTWREGFTALEALIVLAFFGLLITLGAVSISNARARMRDAVRVSDVNMLRAGLSIYWHQTSAYPTSNGMTLGDTDLSDGLTLDGFVPLSQAKSPLLLERVPQGPSSDERYVYTGGLNGYAIRFQTERETSLGPPNVYYMHSTGVDTNGDLK